jgi:predicted phage replisome organizer
MNINWFKLDVNILDNTKIKLIRKYPDGDSIIVLWLGLLCLGMKSDEPGIIKIADGLPYTADELSSIFDISVKTVQLGIELFCKYGMIQAIEGGLMEIIGFRESQSIDKIEYQRAKNREKVARFRLKNKLLENKDVTVTGGNVTDREEKRREEKNRSDKNRVEKKYIQIYESVYMTQKEIDKLIADYGKEYVESKIKDMDSYFNQIGLAKAKKKYKSHYHTFLNWTRMETKKNKPKQVSIIDNLKNKGFFNEQREVNKNDNETF